MPEARAETDASLRLERAKTDEELARRRSDAEAETDLALSTARHDADDALSDHRREHDLRSDPTARVRAERSRADAEVAQDRADADGEMEAERIRRQMAIAGLLLAERQQTDSRLLLERTRTDQVFAHRDEFLAMLSHDMRSLLGAVALGAAVLRNDQQHDPSRIFHYTGSIQRATAQMSRLVTDLLDVASLDAGKFVLVRGPHDAGQMARDAAEAFAPTAADSGIALSADVPGDALIAECDPDRVGQVLANMLGNAVKFTRRGGRITIHVEPRGADICFSVSDTGICFSVSDTGEGIPSEKLATIFDRYSQIGQPDRRGLGLGLYIAQHIVDAHGGRIWVESVVGQGSTFRFTVPMPQKDA